MNKLLFRASVLLLIFGIAVLNMPQQVQAIPVSGFFSGTIDSVHLSIYEPTANFPDDIVAGIAFEGTFSYNTDLPFHDEYSPTRTFLADVNAVSLTLFGSTNKYTFSVVDGGIDRCYYVTDSAPDSFSFRACCGVSGDAGDFYTELLEFETTDSTGTVFNDLSLPTSLTLDEFDSNVFKMFLNSWGGGRVFTG